MVNTDKILDYRLFLQREEKFIRADYFAEFRQYNRIRNGDVDAVKERFEKVRPNYLNGKDGRGMLSQDPLRNSIYHLVSSAAIISRLCIDGGMDMNTAYTLSDIYINEADEAETVEQVLDLIATMQIDYASRMRDLKRTNVINYHVRRTIDYIYNNLNKPMTVTELAALEDLNPVYFSRLFTNETGKKVGDFITEAKIETAKNMMRHSEYSILEIAMSLGYSSQSAFSNAFKASCGMTPKKYRDINNGKL
ncbi:MAG: helix-turn-helix transcriptional regulator [Clostridiales bacterium]|nr:helix-turn-helix transcriptional regulator [Clostridiales bacterium]